MRNRVLFAVGVFIIVTVILCFYVRQPLRYPNVIYISVDALRADHLSCYGYKRATSPNIDTLAREGVIFTQAIAQSSHTPASIGVIITGNLPYKNSLINWGNRVDDATPNLMQILKKKGYRTIFLSNHPAFSKEIDNFAQQFDEYLVLDSDEGSVTKKAMQVLGKDPGRPVFVWVHYMEVHSPYRPSKYLRDLFFHDKYYRQKKLPIVESCYDGYGDRGIPRWLAEQHGNQDNPDYYIALYDAAIRTVDEQIGILRHKLEELKLFDHTLMIISADHGEMLGEKGYYFHHGKFLYEPLLRVPLVIRFGKMKPKMRVVQSQVPAHMSFLPTILDILEIEKSFQTDGSSLLHLIKGKNSNDFHFIFSDEGHATKCIRTKEWKLICTIHHDILKYELYDLKHDPFEEHDLVNTNKEMFGLLKEKLDVYRQVPVKRRGERVLDNASKAKLKSLGYMQ